MQVVPLEEAGSTARGTAVTIGAYDGVHLGHRLLLASLRERAEALGVPTAVLTFDRHPASVVNPSSAPPLLTDAEQKYELLAGCGIDMTVVMRFDADRAQEEAEDFVDTVLVSALGARVVVVGEDFRFGHGRRGNVDVLRSLGATRGFEVVGVPLAAPEGADGAAVSSTRIRGLLADGDVATAAALLGRPHEVRGPVVHGDARGGAELGMPTANVAVPDHIALPAVGIYAGWCRRADGTTYGAAISVGRRPTFYDPADAATDGAGRPLVEAHLLDFSGDLYDERVAVCFVERLRDERRFERIEDLVDQMQADLERTRAIVRR